METTPSHHSPPPVRILRRKRGLAALDLGQVWDYRDLLATLSFRDVQLRYRQTALGAVWVVLQPLMSALIFTFVFRNLANLGTEGVPPLLFTFGGMLAYNVFSGFFGKSSGIIVGNMNLVSKVYFPRLVLPLSGVLSTLLDFAVGFVVFIGLLVVNRWSPGVGIVALPLVLLLLLMLALGMSLFVAAIQVKYRDVAYVVPVLMNMLLFLTPVGFPLSEVHKKIPEFAQFFFGLNPLVGMMELARWSMMGTPFPPMGMVLYSLAFALVVAAAGVMYFKVKEREFADVI